MAQKNANELTAAQNHANELVAINKAGLDAVMNDENATAEQRAQAQADAASKDIAIKNQLERDKAKLANDYAQAQYDLALKQFEAEEAMKKKAFENDKKVKTAQVIIATITGAMAAFTGMAQTFPGPWGLVAGGIAAAAVGVMGAIQVANIQKTQYVGGTAPTKPTFTMPNIQAGAGASSGVPASSPSLKDSTLYATGGGQKGGGAAKPPVQTVKLDDSTPLRAYVLVGDINSAQDAQNALQRKATGF
jgi:hypothetical protein